jgi:hypothetical protein
MRGDLLPLASGVGVVSLPRTTLGPLGGLWLSSLELRDCPVIDSEEILRSRFEARRLSSLSRVKPARDEFGQHEVKQQPNGAGKRLRYLC